MDSHYQGRDVGRRASNSSANLAARSFKGKMELAITVPTAEFSFRAACLAVVNGLVRLVQPTESSRHQRNFKAQDCSDMAGAAKIEEAQKAAASSQCADCAQSSSDGDAMHSPPVPRDSRKSTLPQDVLALPSLYPSSN
ncbi:MAG: hypothetical protein R3F22_06415 [Lysobacteraceae bacterium]